MGELTASEARVIALAAKGLGVRGTAERLGRSVNTVKQQRSRAMRKLQCRSMPQAVAVAIELGLIPSGSGRR